MSAADRKSPPTPSFMAEKTVEQENKPAPQMQTSAINVEKIDRDINESLRKQIVEIINKNPDFALSVLRGWKDR